VSGTSTQPGPLTPALPPPPGDQSFDEVLQGVIAQLVPLTGPMVRPRWQLNPPPQPPATANWCAVGITNEEPRGYDDQVVNSDEQTLTITRLCDVEITASFYGPQAMTNAGILRDAFLLGQNRYLLQSLGLGITWLGAATRNPELDNERFVEKADIVIQCERTVARTYNVTTVLEQSFTAQTPALLVAVTAIT
jgi:hypothetical protein